MILGPNAEKALNNIHWDNNSEDYGTSFKGNPELSVVSCYSPTNTSEEFDVEDFYNDLNAVVRQVPSHNVLIVAGDFNAKLGKSEDHPFTHAILQSTETEPSLLILNLETN